MGWYHDLTQAKARHVSNTSYGWLADGSCCILRRDWTFGTVSAHGSTFFIIELCVNVKV